MDGWCRRWTGAVGNGRQLGGRTRVSDRSQGHLGLKTRQRDCGGDVVACGSDPVRHLSTTPARVHPATRLPSEHDKRWRNRCFILGAQSSTIAWEKGPVPRSALGPSFTRTLPWRQPMALRRRVNPRTIAKPDPSKMIDAGSGVTSGSGTSDGVTAYSRNRRSQPGPSPPVVPQSV